MMLSVLLDELDATRRHWGRVGECWPRGPLNRAAGPSTERADYIERLRAVEAKFDKDRVSVCRQLRRLYYSSHDCRPARRRRGTLLDVLMTGGTEYPLAWSPDADGISAEVLDDLYGITHLAFSQATLGPTDLGAFFAALEAALGGPSELGLVAEDLTGVPFGGIATWVGDLSIWFLTWNQARENAETSAREGIAWTEEKALQALDKAQRAWCPLERVLGSMDGQIVARHLGDGLRESFDRLPAWGDTLGAYFSEAGGIADPAISVTRRFGDFLVAAAPGIPHAGSGNVALADGAAERLQQYVSAVSKCLLYLAGRDRRLGRAIDLKFGGLASHRMTDIASEVAAQSSTIAVIVDRFVAFLRAGLAGATEIPDWPRHVAAMD